MQPKRKSPSVTFQVVLPSETITVEGESGELLTAIKSKIALSNGLQRDSFHLTFNEEEVGDDGDERLVMDLPFEDQSTLKVVCDKKHLALMSLRELGIEVEDASDLDNRFITTDIINLLLDTEESGWELNVMFQAVDLARAECVRVLLERSDVDPNSRDDEDYTLLHTAAASHMKGHEEVVGVLLEHGANIEQGDPHGLTALHYVCAVGCTKGGGHDAASRHKVASLLLEEGLYVDTVVDYYDDETVLFGVVTPWRKGCEELAKLLLTHEADPNLRNTYGNTVLNHLILCGNNSHTDDSKHRMVSILLDHGADVNKGPNLYHAVACGHRNIAALLLEHGADVNAKCSGKTALLLAAFNNALDIVCLLLEHNADTFAKDQDGRTALDLTNDDDVKMKLSQST